MDQKSEEVPSEQLEGFVYTEHLNWWEVAHADEALFTSGLRDLGLPDGEIAEAWSVFSQTYRPLAKVDSEIDELNERYRGISFATAPADLVRLYEKRQGIVTRLNDGLRSALFGLIGPHSQRLGFHSLSSVLQPSRTVRPHSRQAGSSPATLTVRWRSMVQGSAE